MIITWQEILIIIAIIIAVIVIFTTINVCLFKQSHCPFPLSLLPFWSEKECPEKTCPECPRIEEYEKWNFNTIEYSPGGNIFGDKKADSYLTSLTNGSSSQYYCDNDADNKCRLLPPEATQYSYYNSGKAVWVPKCGNEYNHQFFVPGGRLYCSKVAPSKEYVKVETALKDTDKLPLSYCCNVSEVYENGKMVTRITNKQNKPSQCPPFPCPQSTTSRNVNDNDCCKLDVDEVYENGKFVRKNRNINSSLQQCKNYICSTDGTTSRDVNTRYDCIYGPERLLSSNCVDVKTPRIPQSARTTINYISDLINTNISVCPPTRGSQSINTISGKKCPTTPPPTTTPPTTTPRPTTTRPTSDPSASQAFWEKVRQGKLL
jgi:hypothetical protein